MIVSIGEALIDYKNGKSYIGGCPYNVALTVARMQCSSLFLGGISKDDKSKLILESLINNEVFFDPVFCNSEKRTMTTDAIVEGSTVRYEFDWKDSSAFDISNDKLCTAFDFNSDIDCVFTGSVSFSDKTVRKEIMNFIKGHESFIKVLDPNVRPFVIEDKKAYISDLEECFKEFDIVKISDEDLSFFEKTENEILMLCKDNLVVTRGPYGSSWYSKSLNKQVSVSAVRPKRIKDTIGCGDVFSGVMLSMLEKAGKFKDFKLNEDDIRSVMEKASVAAALNCEEDGCNPPKLSDIDE